VGIDVHRMDFGVWCCFLHLRGFLGEIWGLGGSGFGGLGLKFGGLGGSVFRPPRV